METWVSIHIRLLQEGDILRFRNVFSGRYYEVTDCSRNFLIYSSNKGSECSLNMDAMPYKLEIKVC